MYYCGRIPDSIEEVMHQSPGKVNYNKSV